MANKPDPSAVLFLKGGAIHVLATARTEDKEFGRCVKVVASGPVGAPARQLAADIKKALDSCKVCKTDKDLDRLPSAEATLAGAAGIESFRSGLGVVLVKGSRQYKGFGLIAGLPNLEELPGRESWFYKDTKPDPEEIRNTVLEFSALSLEGPAVVAANRKLAVDLEALGMFRTAPDPQAALEEVQNKGWAATLWSACDRAFHADAENLAEGGLGDVVAEMIPFFNAMKVKPPEVADESTEAGYALTFDGEPVTVLSAEDLETDDDKPGNFWGLASYRCAQLLNGALAKRGLAERCYAVNNGNDLNFMLITPEMHKAITAAPWYEPTYGPYEITGDYPNFGQPIPDDADGDGEDEES